MFVLKFENCKTGAIRYVGCSSFDVNGGAFESLFVRADADDTDTAYRLTHSTEFKNDTLIPLFDRCYVMVDGKTIDTLYAPTPDAQGSGYKDHPANNAVNA